MPVSGMDFKENCVRRRWSIGISVVLVFAMVLSGARPARASIPTGTEIVLIFVAVGVVGAAVGITVYHFAHKPPSLTGCTISSASGFSLE